MFIYVGKEMRYHISKPLKIVPQNLKNAVWIQVM